MIFIITCCKNIFGYKIDTMINFYLFSIIRIIRFVLVILQVEAPLKTLELQESAQRKGNFALFNCLVIRHTKYKGVQRVYCNPFSAKPFHGCMAVIEYALDSTLESYDDPDNGNYAYYTHYSNIICNHYYLYYHCYCYYGCYGDYAQSRLVL